MLYVNVRGNITLHKRFMIRIEEKHNIYSDVCVPMNTRVLGFDVPTAKPKFKINVGKILKVGEKFKIIQWVEIFHN